jgi:uncharacterized protein (TIGR03084 family)
MEDIVAALDDQQVELDEILRALDPDGWARPSRCVGWSVSDVVLHLAQTNEMAIGSLTGTYDQVLERFVAGLDFASSVDDGAGLMVDKERGAPPDEVYARFRNTVDQLMSLFWEADPHDRVQWVAGTLSAQTLATTRLAETWIHTNDVARTPPSSRLKYIARLAWRTLPYAFTRAGREMKGTVAFELEGPNGKPWVFAPETPADTVVRGLAIDLCEVAAQRATAPGTSLVAEGPDAADVLELVRTFA